MAHPRIVAAQRLDAQNRLVASASRAAEALGIGSPEIPMWSKDPEALPALQANAISDFLDNLADRAQVARLKAAAVRELAVAAGVEEESISDIEAAIDEVDVVLEPIEGEPVEGGSDVDLTGEPSGENVTGEAEGDTSGLELDGALVDVEPLVPEDPAKCKDGESTEDCAKRQAENRRRREQRAAKKADAPKE